MKSLLGKIVRIALNGAGGAVVGTAGDLGMNTLIEYDDPVLAAVLAVATAMYRLAVELKWINAVTKVLK